jgi:uncharacterized protein (TIGR03000 family)
MKYSISRVALGLVLGSVLIFSSPSAEAGWGSLGGSYGSSGGGSSGGSSGYVASYGSSGGGSSGGSAGYGSTGASFTPVRSFLRGIHDHIAAKIERHHARRASYASYGSSGYSSVGHGSTGYGSTGYGSTGYSAGYGSSGGSSGSVSYGSYGSAGTAVSYGSTGSVAAPVSYSGTEGSTHYGSSIDTDFSASLVSAVQHADEDAVYLTVSLPSSARVLVNGKATTSTGSVRQFVSRGLVPGKTYKFEVHAELDAADGQIVTEDKTVLVTAGTQEQLQFAFAEADAAVKTSLTLNVPEEAKVLLSGNSTRATGNQRVYQTSQLKVGQVWEDYTVEVEVNGQVKRQSIRLIGGDSLELTFDFESESVDQLASTR